MTERDAFSLRVPRHLRRGAARGGAPQLIILGTVAVVQARFALYSASLAPIYKDFPRLWRIVLAQLLTDQAAALEKHFTPLPPDPVRRRWFFFGGASLFTAMAAGGAMLGIVIGPVIPASWYRGAPTGEEDEPREGSP